MNRMKLPLTLSAVVALAGSSFGCILTISDDVGTSTSTSETGTTSTSGDGDGDATTGDGDGEPATGDGDGEPATTGDGDGEPATTGDGDGEPAPAGCGWAPEGEGYYCEGEGEDPSGMFPFACPEGIAEGDPCGDITGAGCCDANGDNWFCTVEGTLGFEAC